MKVVIFVGPSIPLAEARAVLPDATYLPPARQVDLLSAIGIHKPDVVGLIDGEFGQSLSVWHKEILYALDRGVYVYGSSSMGALRAAETAEFGMRGVGRVFEMYASGELNDDDEVALAHGLSDAGYRNFSEPMVNLRATFARLRDEGSIDAAGAQRLIDIAKALFFPDRTFPRIFEEAAAQGMDRNQLERARARVKTAYVDLKHEDALELLRTIRDLPQDTPRSTPVVALNRSHLFETLYNRDRRVRHDGFEVALAAIANRTALHQPDFNDLNFQALNRALMTVLADLLQVRVTDDEIAQELRRFRTSRGLSDDAALEHWLGGNDLEPAELQELVTQVALCRKLQRWLINSRFGERTTRYVLDELRLRGEYEAAAQETARQERIIEDHHQDFKETSFSHLTTRELVLEHLRATRCRMPVHFRQWAEEAGFHTVTDLRVELLRARLVRLYSAGVADRLASALTGSEEPSSASASSVGTAS